MAGRMMYGGQKKKRPFGPKVPSTRFLRKWREEIAGR